MKKITFLLFLFLTSKTFASGGQYYKIACAIMRDFVKPYGINLPFGMNLPYAYFKNLHYASQGGHKKARIKLENSAEKSIKYPNLLFGYSEEEDMSIREILSRYLPKE